jgi:lanthanide-dependent methanol dehydrogenase
MIRRVAPTLLLLAATLPAMAFAQPPQPPTAAAPAEDGNWPMPAKNYASTRFSELDEIDTTNVGKLQVAFTFSSEVMRGRESAPIVIDGTLYFVEAM